MKNLSFFNRLILRTPGFSIQSYFGVLTSEVNNDYFREALFFASPDLLHQWTAKDELNDSLKVAIKKYHSRITSRCTPFGLFAGCSVINWGDSTSIVIDENKTPSQRQTRLDMLFLCRLAIHILKNDDIKRQVLFHPNSTAYRFNDNIRYVEYRFEALVRKLYLTQVENLDVIEKILDFCQSGKRIEEIEQLVVEIGFELEEATDFTNQLIDSQVLLSDFEPQITRNDYLDQLIEVLVGLNDRTQYIELTISTLLEIQSLIKALDVAKTNNIENYNNLTNLIKLLGVDFEINQLFQVDFHKQAKDTSTLNENIQNLLAECVLFVNGLPAPPNDLFKKFKNSFREVYGEQEVLLVHVLDRENGIDYRGEKKVREEPMTEYDRIMFSVFEDSLRTNKTEIDLFHLDRLKAIISDNSKRLPPTFAVMLNHLGTVDGEDQLQLAWIMGASAINILGRFGGSSGEINDVISEVVSFEDSQLNNDWIFAEIVHLPAASRVGNIMLHPPYRKFEMFYLAKPTADELHRIEIGDLMLSLRGDKFYLRSKRLNKYIIPRLSNMHAYNNDPLPIYQFLSDLQNDGSQIGNFSWGKLSSLARHFPRVKYKGIILFNFRHSMNKFNLIILIGGRLIFQPRSFP